jgi:hypothetical protein
MIILSRKLATIAYEKMINISPRFRSRSQAESFHKKAVMVHPANIIAITA